MKRVLLVVLLLVMGFAIVRANVKLRRLVATDRATAAGGSDAVAVKVAEQKAVEENGGLKTATSQAEIDPHPQAEAVLTRSDVTSNPKIESLKREYAEQEAAADLLSQELRKTSQPAEDQKQKLRQLVTQAFALRQQLHKAELTAFQQRIAKVEQTIRTREAMQEQIINRRVEDLINPDLNWDAPPVIPSTESTQPNTPPTIEVTKLDSADSKSISNPTTVPRAETIEADNNTPTELEGEWVLQTVPDEEFVWSTGWRCRFRNHLWSFATPSLGPEINTIAVDTANKSFRVKARGNDPQGGFAGILTRYQVVNNLLQLTFRIGDNEYVTEWERSSGNERGVLYVTPPWPETNVTAVDQKSIKDGSTLPLKHSPGVFALQAGKSHLLQLSNLSNYHDRVIIAKIDLPMPSAAAYDYLSFHGLPLVIKSDLVHRLAGGTALTHVIYVPDSKLAGDQPAAETVATSSLNDDSIVAEARKLGTVLAVVRLEMMLPGSHLGTLNGNWYLESITGAGLAPHDESGLRCHIEGDQWTMIRGNNATSDYRIDVNPNVTPQTIDMTAARGDKPSVKTSRGIYRVEGDKVVVAWGIIESIRPDRFDAPGVAIHTWNRIHERDKHVQISLLAPAGAIVTRPEGGVDSNGVALRDYVLPARLALEAGTHSKLRIKQISTHPRLEQIISLEIPFVSNASREFLRQNPVPIEFTVDEFDHTEFGRSIEKAIYLPHSDATNLQPAGVKTLLNTSLAAGSDLMAEANKIGTVLAIVRTTMGLKSDATSNNPLAFDLTRATPPVPLANAVAQVNESQVGAHSINTSLSLTEDEVIASIRWALTMQTKMKFDESDKRALKKITEQRLIPSGWTINRYHAFPDGEDEAFPILATRCVKRTIRLICPSTERYIDIRKEYFAQSASGEVVDAELVPISPSRLVDKAVSLADAIRDFNAGNHTIAGQRQPPLTEREVLMAIRDWKNHRQEVAYASDAMFAKFQSIADSRQLPLGVTIEVIPRFEGGQYNFDFWSVRIKLPIGDAPNSATNSIPIRERFVRSSLPGETTKEELLESPGFNSAVAVKRDGKADNLRVLMLAMWKYENEHKRFPAAVVLGKNAADKGTVPHSWRVEILPQLGEQKLYDEYHFDEAWDSEHNKSLISKMPAVFRAPLDAAGSTNTSYFGLVTPGFKPRIVDAEGAATDMGDKKVQSPLKLSYDQGTMFSNPDGAAVSDCIDGTSNTVFLVEAKRAIPWTKPEDIVYSPDGPLPKLGEWDPVGWHAGFADGQVKFLSDQNDNATLRALFTIGGGEVVKPRLFDDTK